MRKVYVASSLAIAVVVAGIFVVSSSPPIEVKTAPSNVTASSTPAAHKSPSAVSAKPGKYVAYTDADSVASTPGTKVLFFHAPWCPQCRDLDKDIQSSQLPDNLTIFKVDYDSNNELRAKYGVTLQTTFVRIDDNAKLVKKYVAYAQPNFASVKLNLLD